MKRIDELFTKTKQDIASGIYGCSGCEFLTIRAYAERFHCSLRVAMEVFRCLQDDNLIRLSGKKYYVTTGFCSSLTPYGARLSDQDGALFGILVDDNANPFVGKLTNALCTAIYRDGGQAIFGNSRGDNSKEKEIMKLFLQLKCKGVFVCLQISHTEEEFFARYPLPIVTLADEANIQNSDVVLVDNTMAGKQVAHHLIDCGCHSFAYVTSDAYLDFDRRLTGYREGLKEEGYSLSSENTGVVSEVGTMPDPQKIASFVQNLLHRVKRDPEALPLGIFCFHDMIALDVMQAVKNYSIKNHLPWLIPDDVMIVGFDDLAIASMVSPSMTTISYRYAEIADKAYEVMTDYLHNPSHQTSRYEISSFLTVRETTKHSSLNRAYEEHGQ